MLGDLNLFTDKEMNIFSTMRLNDNLRALLVVDQPEILAKKVIVLGLNVRQTEQLVKRRTKIAGNPVGSEIYSNDSEMAVDMLKRF